MSKGSELWNEAKTIIPGGNQLLSKRSEMFLPGAWPSYYVKAKGCEVWDLDDRHYYDFAQMGVGACILGYADQDVNLAVKKAIDDASMCTLNAWEEVALAKKLVALHPWAEMARFSRTGGEACAIAVRIGRAATGRDKVAFCGYHGWHDWYLATNLGAATNLDEQLLPGLKPRGVPRSLINTSLPFNYNNLAELEKIVANNQNEIGVIIMEPVRNTPPQPGFLEGVRAMADRIGAVLIFDEVTSGFRVNLGGIHLTYGVEPDLAIFGKAIGNGYPISAVIGRKQVMDVSQESFISSTFWTERLGFTAALATLTKVEALDVPAKLKEYGQMINQGWQSAAEAAGLKINVFGIEPLTHISFDHPEALAMQTYYTQEMLKRGFLVGAAVYTTYAYSPEIINKFITASRQVFAVMGQQLKAGETIAALLEGPIKHSGFKRLV
jgi:glutamate-1-semialdehyde aminotransferase